MYFKPLLLKSTVLSQNPPEVISRVLFILVIPIYALPFSHMPRDPGCPLEKDFSAQAYVRRLAFLRVNILTYLSLLAGFPLEK